MVDQLAARGMPDVSGLIELDQDIQWPLVRIRAEVLGAERALAVHEAVDVVGLLSFFLTPEVLIKRLDALIDAESDDKAALSVEARQQAEVETQGDLLDIERQEAALVWQAQAQGLPIEHRADISPLALLAVRLVTTPRGEAAAERRRAFHGSLRR